MALLCWARALVEWVPFERWRGTLGFSGGAPDEVLGTARRLADQVERAASRLPIHTRCLPRAVALSWLLRTGHIGHVLVIAARPAELRATAEPLHAWVEVDRMRLIGDLPGPWIEVLRLQG
jgi:aryl-alcohol dehydrogenase-like predicted oxidoreductase